MRFVIFLLLSLMVPCVALAEECNTTLKETDSYQELSIILNCLSRKINLLEADLKKAKSEGVISPDDAKPVALLDNKFITVFDLKVSNKETTVLVSFIVKSKFDKDILLAILHDSPILTDEFGDSTIRASTTGIRSLYKGTNSEREYTVLNPGVPTPVSIRFDAGRMKGKEFSIRVGLLHLIADKPVEYSFGKTKIRVDQ